jgi:formylglycine-generating enzyme required for sulfatase activity
MQAAVSAARNPKGPSSGTFRVVRGASWFYVSPSLFRAAFRIWYKLGFTYGNVGFRCAKAP